MFTYLADGEGESASLDYAALDRRARSVAAAIRAEAGEGARVLLLFNAGPEYIESFFGCLYAGVIAVPAEVPRSERHLPRFLSIATDSAASLVLTTRRVLEQMRRRVDPAEAQPELHWVCIDELPDAEWRTGAAGGGEIAYLQYTSGSTAAPKGVMVSHGNVLANLAEIDAGFRHSPSSIAVNWLPHYHDMGLVYGLLAPIWGGFRSYVMSPAAFIQNPIRWLRAMTKYRATHSGGPNFAYDLCVQKIAAAQRAELDLSSWRVAFNGAEPVRRATLTRFAEAFEPAGFRFDSFHPAYGLAEATLKVSARDPERPVRFAGSTVSCGVPAGATRIEILDGEICVTGPSVAPGYWNRPDDLTFRGGVLHTGDIGFVMDGELYVSGRVKDLILIRGRNLYPQDVELTAETAHPAMRANAGAAFSIDDDGQERLVIVQEIERGREDEAGDALHAIRRDVASTYEVYAHGVVLVRAASIPKTSSGKIQRQLTKDRFVAGELNVVASSVGVPEVGAVADSLTAMELQAQLEREYGIEVPLSGLLGGARAVSEPPEPIGAAPVARVSIEQERLWLLDRLEHGNPAFHVPTAVQFASEPDLARVRAAVHEIVRRHEPLRTCFEARDGRPVPVVRESFELEIVSGRANEEFVRRPFDLARGPLFRMALDGRILTVVFHHIAADLWSAGLFARELAVLYEGRPLAPLPVRYTDFAAWQRERLAAMQADIDFWRRKLEQPPKMLWPTGKGAGGIEEFALSAELTARVKRWSRERGVTPFMTYLAAHVLLLHRYTGQHEFIVGVPAAGRPSAEVRDLVGFFAYPILLRVDLSGEPTFEETVRRVREAALEAYDHQEVPFAKVVEAASSGYCSVRAPLTDVLFSMVPEPDLTGPVQAADAPGAPTDFDAFLTFVERRAGGIRALLAHNLGAEAARGLAASYGPILEQAVGAPALPASQFELRGLEARRTQTLAVAASFTAEPLQPALEFWMEELRMPSRVRFAGYRQVFQSLLDPNGLFAGNRDGVNVVLVRLADWPHDVRGEILQAVRGRNSTATTLVAICPSGEAYSEAEAELARELQGVAGVHVLTPERTARWYPVSAVDDPHANELGHVPYTEDYFAALGTAIARTISGIRRAPYKVIVTDCDQTLWKGVCGEDGPEGVEIDAPRLALQRTLVEQHRAGMLIALASKNNEDDVDAVFERRADMPLSAEHIVARRINWQPKSEGLRGLSRELLLGPESFIFFDDNPVECAEVMEALPDVLTVELPEDGAEWEPFLKHLWPLDHLRITDEDRARTQLYKQESQRRALERESVTLASFLEGLRLRINIAEPAPEQIARIAQLTQRTNQFNTTTVRRSEAEIGELLSAGTLEARAVRVSDRFGDYGLVGAMIFAREHRSLVVDSFLLSCRALGRGVEHRMLAELGRIAATRGLEWVDVAFVPSRKNRPALQFLDHAGPEARLPREAGAMYRFRADESRRCEYRPEGRAVEAPTVPAAQPVRRTDRVDWIRIGRSLSAVEQIRAALALRKPAAPARAVEYVEPRTPLEQELAGIWSELLHAETVGAEADFFALGGHSLLAVQLLSRVRDRYQVELPLDVVFSGRFTVAALAGAIERYEIEQAGASGADLAAEIAGLSEEEVQELLRTEQGRV